MEEKKLAENTASVEEQEFKQIDSFNLKAGPFSIWINIISGILFIAVLVSLFFIFDVIEFVTSDPLHSLIQLGLAFGIIIAGFLLIFVIRIIIIKISGCGKIHLHFGLLIDVYGQKPIKKLNYFLSDIISGSSALIIVIIIAAFNWNAFTYLAFTFFLITFLTNIPIFIFELRQPKDALIKIENGEIISLIKNIERDIT